MLVLTRKKGEQILIDKGQIEIHVLYIDRGKVAIGIRASREIDVDRKEIFIRKQANPSRDGNP